ncbi:hypothetical protein O6H91_10G044200 [Diphasiastrum complanatum]|uniref:Uncharacterized protein n=1 Tax=Diphasiastrum complanatum TaxID=34168 RepID=A0ACC2CHA9_DIPCM|nr:hypothetical protein O6H91_10G044200 [Diphasiastrum complanatum]
MRSDFQSAFKSKTLRKGSENSIVCQQTNAPLIEITNTCSDEDWLKMHSKYPSKRGDKHNSSNTHNSINYSGRKPLPKRPVASFRQSPKKSHSKYSLSGISTLKSINRGLSSREKTSPNPSNRGKVPNKKPWTPTGFSSSTAKDGLLQGYTAIGGKRTPKTVAPVCLRGRCSPTKTKEASILQAESRKLHEKACVPSPDNFRHEMVSQEMSKLTDLQKQILKKVQGKPICKVKKDFQIGSKPSGRMARRLSQVVRSEGELLKQNKAYAQQLQELQQLFSNKDSEVESFHVAGKMLKQLYNKEAEELKALKAAFPTTLKEITHLQELCGKQEQELRELQSVVPALKEQVTYLKSRLRTLELELVKERSEKVLLNGIVKHANR